MLLDTDIAFTSQPEAVSCGTKPCKYSAVTHDPSNHKADFPELMSYKRGDPPG